MNDADPFEEAAFVGIGFTCRFCGTVLNDERLTVRYPIDGWIECLASAAKTAGWLVAFDGEDLLETCPECRRKIAANH